MLTILLTQTDSTVKSTIYWSESVADFKENIVDKESLIRYLTKLRYDITNNARNKAFEVFLHMYIYV